MPNTLPHNILRDPAAEPDPPGAVATPWLRGMIYLPGRSHVQTFRFP
jgi:hypothetical protein